MCLIPPCWLNSWRANLRSKYSKDLAGSKTPYLSYLTLLQKLNRFRGHLAMPRFEPVLSVCQAVSDSSEVSARVDCMAQRKRSRLPPGRLGFKSLRFVKFVNDVNIIKSQNTSIRTWRSYLLDVSSISGGIKNCFQHQSFPYFSDATVTAAFKMSLPLMWDRKVFVNGHLISQTIISCEAQNDLSTFFSSGWESPSQQQPNRLNKWR